MPTTTVDLKNMEHAQKEALLFPGIEALKEGDTLRIVVDFNPIPLVYLLKAQDKFSLKYEKEGPGEWILLVTRNSGLEKEKAQFKDLLTAVKQNEVTPETKEKARKLLENVDAKTLGTLEQELIREGVSHEEIRKSLCDVHLEIIKDSLVAKRIDVSAPHPIHTFMQEHEIILSNLVELGHMAQRLQAAASLAGMGEDLGKLRDIAHHLVEAEKHHQREEEALFPELEKHDIVEPPRIMVLDHIEFRKRKQELFQLAQNPEQTGFAEFKTRVGELSAYLGKELDSHIFKENNILYQIALQILNAEEWAKIKTLCDKIGYCCFTPKDQQQGEGKMVELDLRPIMAFERHELIFEKWDALRPGETLRIINDHNPKPLRYQFEAEYKGKFEWAFEEEGPKDWIFTIKKL